MGGGGAATSAQKRRTLRLVSFSRPRVLNLGLNRWDGSRGWSQRTLWNCRQAFVCMYIILRKDPNFVRKDPDLGSSLPSF